MSSKLLVVERRPVQVSRWPWSERVGVTREQILLVLSPLSLLVMWEVFSRTRLLDPRIFSSPSAVAVMAWQLILEGDLPAATRVTLQRLVLGSLAGILPGLALGLLMGVFRTPRAIVNPLVSAIYPLPRIALFPLVLLVVGLNEISYLIMVALGPFFSMLITTVSAVQNVDPIYLRVARSFKARTWDLYRLVVLPAALPVLFGGLRLSLGMALLGVVAVEFLNTGDGLGYMIWHSWMILSLGESMVGLVTCGLVGFLMFFLLDWVQRCLLPWWQQP
jgi:NitT/TauT family transport system permease protein